MRDVKDLPDARTMAVNQFDMNFENATLYVGGSSMNSSERIKCVLSGGIPDRIPVCEQAFWPQTIRRWRNEGLPENTDPVDYLGIDRIVSIAYESGFFPDRKLIEETEEYLIYFDKFGNKKKEWKEDTLNYGTPQHISPALKGRSDWRNVRARLKASREKIPPQLEGSYRTARERGDFIYLNVEEPAWFIIDRTFGFENGLSLLLEDRDFSHEIMEALTSFNLDMCRLLIEKGLIPDALYLSSDLCYKKGMLFSPALYRSLIHPHVQKISDFCSRNNLHLIYHCDGYVRDFIPLLVELGVHAIEPLEARCGNDVREYKKLFGDSITLFGNISADILSSDRKHIYHEVTDKLKIAMGGGRYIFHSDHSIPPTVSFDNYRYAVALAMEKGRYSGI